MKTAVLFVLMVVWVAAFYLVSPGAGLAVACSAAAATLGYELWHQHRR